ncbi:protease modulator HflC [Porticoccus sp. W117]|uniref:protease modulator HflC n=1 Tax=Porticoccus sp. W117 TaxID=3054777 RepID=UPI002598DBC4|nr:protease modulator HflC [Porticoccus sp. W117]MDM3871566.1 protease modulator HflC [Porticoccus sp. W117]
MKVSHIIAIVVLGLIAINSVYRVQETEKAVLLEFGKIEDANLQPGLHFKIPVVQEVKIFDARVLTLDAKPESYYTIQKKRLDVDSFVKWRINDVETYYKATGGVEQTAMNRLQARANDGLRNEFGKRTLHEVVSGERDQLMELLTVELNQAVQQDLGIEVVDVRVKKIDFPQEVSGPVYDRMRTDREKEARQYRSEGNEEAVKIRADADRQKVVIEAEAYREAEQLRGDGDAKAAGIYADAYNKDPEFYAFLRSLEAYKQSFANKGDMMLVDPDSEFFRYLKDSKGK